MERRLQRFCRVFLASLGLMVLVFMLGPFAPPPDTTDAWPELQQLPCSTSTPSLTGDDALAQPSSASSYGSSLIPWSSGPNLSYEDLTTLIDLPDFIFTLSAKPCVDEDDVSSTQYDLLVFVHSAPSHLSHRMAIRSTWGSPKIKGIRVLFMLGETLDQQALEIEQSRHHDLIQGTFVDTYRNITYKHVMALKWITYNCPLVPYVLKTDDDVFINMPKLLKTLPTLPSSRLIFCDVITSAKVKRSWRSKWRVSYDEFKGRTYPNYCAGWAILYTRDVVQRLYAESQGDSYFWVDDVQLTGVVAERLGYNHLSSGPWKLTSEKDVERILSLKKLSNIGEREEELIDFLVGPYDVQPHVIQALWSALIDRAQ